MNCTVSVILFLRPPCDNNFEKSREAHSAIIGSTSEDEEFCAHRDGVLKLPESRRIAMMVRKRLPSNSTCAKEEVADSGRRTHLGQSLSLDQMGEPSGFVGEAEADEDRGSSFESCIQKNTTKGKEHWRLAEHDVEVESFLSSWKSASAEMMLEKLAVTTRTRMR